MAEQDKGLKEQFRAAAIQAFENTFELSYKMIQRQLKQIVPNPGELKKMNFMEVIRTAQDAGLIREAPNFREYREKGNITSRTYDENKAAEIMTVMNPFLRDINFLMSELKKRNENANETD